MKAHYFALILVLVTGGCAAMIEGPTQTLTVNTKPVGAHCVLTRAGVKLGEMTTPGTLYVEKTKHDIQIECQKPGYEVAKYINESGVAAAALGNIALNTPVNFAGAGFDSATGSDNKYDTPVTLMMVKKGSGDTPTVISENPGMELPAYAERVAYDVKENMYKTSERVQKWITKAPPNRSKHAVPASYCYQSFQDVLCYRQPMAGWEARLVGYQGTGAAPPPPAVTQPLPMREQNMAMLPENRAANAKPLALTAEQHLKAQAEKEAESKTDDVKAITIDAAHESLPDPALAPQL